MGRHRPQSEAQREQAEARVGDTCGRGATRGLPLTIKSVSRRESRSCTNRKPQDLREEG